MAGPLASQTGDPARWALAEVRQIGSLDDPETALTSANDALLGPEGRLFLLQPLDRSLRVFGRDGVPLGVVGSAGPGPGEFTSPTTMGWNDGDIYVVDGVSRRIAVFDTSGRLARDWRPPIRSPHRQVRAPAPVALLEGGFVLVNGRMAFGASDGEGVPERFFVVDSTGAPVGARFTLDRRHSRYAIRNPENPILGYFSDQPLGDSPLLAVDPRGRFITVAERSVEGLSSEADSASIALRRIDPGGDTVWTATVLVLARPATEQLRDSVFASEWDRVRRARGPGMSIPEKRAALEEVLYLPEVLPPVDGAVVDFEGNTWLRLWPAAPNEPSRWLVMNSDGELLATAIGPPDATLLDHRDGRVLAGVKDQLDVQYVVVLERGRN